MAVVVGVGRQRAGRRSCRTGLAGASLCAKAEAANKTANNNVIARCIGFIPENVVLSLTGQDGRQRPDRKSGSFQLGVLLYQLLQAEARKLYRNLGFFAFSFALIDGAFAIFWMANLLAGAKSALAGGLFHRRFREGNFLPRLAKNSAMFSMEL